MEWGDKKNHAPIYVFHKCDRGRSTIFKTLQPLVFAVMFVYRAIELYKCTGDAKDRHRSKSSRTVKGLEVDKAAKI